MKSGCGSIIALFIFIFVFVPLISSACESDESKEERLRKTAEEPQIVVDGQNGVFMHQTFVAVNKEAYDVLSSYIIQDNTEGIYAQISRGEVFIGNRGEQVRVLDSGFMTSYVEVVETGYRGYVDSEMVRSKLPK